MSKIRQGRGGFIFLWPALLLLLVGAASLYAGPVILRNEAGQAPGRPLAMTIAPATPDHRTLFRLAVDTGNAAFAILLPRDSCVSCSPPQPLRYDGRPGAWLTAGDKFAPADKLVTHQFYERPDGFEWEIILPRRPALEELTFPIIADNLEFLFQDSLFDSEIAAGADRPDSVIGSYAVYFSARDNDADSLFGTGKLFHIYRPRAHDSRGEQALCELRIDSFLTIRLPEKFLDCATYPITIDPTFGNTAVGASTAYLSNTVCHALSGSSSYRHTAGAGEIIVSYSLYCLTYSNPAYVSFAAYSFADGAPDARLASNVVMTVTNGSMQWNTTSSVSQAMACGVTYVAAFGDISPASSIRARFDSETNVVSVHNAASLPANWSHSSYANYRWSVYATYTTGATSLPLRRRHLIAGALFGR